MHSNTEMSSRLRVIQDSNRVAVDGAWKIRAKSIMGWSGAVLSGFKAHAAKTTD